MLKIFLIICLILFIFPRILKWALRGFVVSQFNKAQQDFNQKQQSYHSSPNRREGQIDVDFVPPKKGKSTENFDGGEYIDYEEVK
ncbi:MULTISPECIES: DUF4834 family protein [unclassified Arcicella]|uniref:DUF4834 family protein n=1 Tax=unclassified Arcicella TaxID=2644986 RepID=UPI00285A9145|nr:MULTISPECIES: DUF4834 family protein [unclassified Arcicella]MDR6560675.1 hypothetical protein [Arcicella sp. BE51]MDR6810559.1 hypothetical protein [Arcicella sp. BE140]MDR6821909.1 hypothetical protein [Arcicella sp. BE139]